MGTSLTAALPAEIGCERAVSSLSSAAKITSPIPVRVARGSAHRCSLGAIPQHLASLATRAEPSRSTTPPHSRPLSRSTRVQKRVVQQNLRDRRVAARGTRPGAPALLGRPLSSPTAHRFLLVGGGRQCVMTLITRIGISIASLSLLFFRL